MSLHRTTIPQYSEDERILKTCRTGTGDVSALATTPTPTSHLSNSAISTSTTSSTRPTSSSYGAYNCPTMDQTIYTARFGSAVKFQILCSIDWYGPGLNGRGDVIDITRSVAYSIEDCIDECAANRVGGGNCTALSYGANITLALERGGIAGNCALKDQRSLENITDTTEQEATAWMVNGGSTGSGEEGES